MRNLDAITVRQIFEIQRARLLGSGPQVELAVAALEELEILSANESVGAEVISFLFEPTQLPQATAKISDKRLTENYCRLVLKLLGEGKVSVEQISALTEFFQGVISRKLEFLTEAPKSLFELFYSAGKKDNFFNEIKANFCTKEREVRFVKSTRSTRTRFANNCGHSTQGHWVYG